MQGAHTIGAAVAPDEILTQALALYGPLGQGVEGSDDIISLALRIVVGLMFLVSGYTKLFNKDRAAIMYETMITARIPLPRLNAFFVSLVEWLAGLAFVFGLFTLASGALLFAITLVALMTIGRSKIEPGGFWFVVSGYLYTSEVLIMSAIATVVLIGPGALSVDSFLLPGLLG
jgi:uncharacterized membrane protein YphA (DoxX/SURF4 family)